MNKIYIYDKETLELLGVPFITTLEEFKENPAEFYPDWDNRTMIIAETEVQYPIIDEETGFLRDKTREERILLDNEKDLLEDGEYVENGKIIFIEYNEALNYYKKAWDKENHIWYDATTEEEFIEMRKNKILKYSELEKQKKELESSKFSSADEIQMITEEMLLIEKEINALAEKIETFKA